MSTQCTTDMAGQPCMQPTVASRPPLMSVKPNKKRGSVVSVRHMKETVVMRRAGFVALLAYAPVACVVQSDAIEGPRGVRSHAARRHRESPRPSAQKRTTDGCPSDPT